MARSQREHQESETETDIALYPVSFYLCWEIKMFVTLQLCEVYYVLMFAALAVVI
jgi:hypothetical protein